MKRPDLDPDANFCESCAQRPATQLYQGDPAFGYCDSCAGKMKAEDGGVVFYAFKVMATAMAAINEEIGDPAEVRRLADLALEMALSPHWDGHVDVPAFKMAEKYVSVAA
jgi:hypothetical protein